jgi:hypothetical protein
MAFLGRLEPEIPGPLIGQFLVGRRPRRVHLRQIEPDILLEQVDAADRRQGQSIRDRRHGDPMAVLLSEIFDGRARLAVFADQRRHQVIGRLPHFRLCRAVPARLTDDVVSGAGLPLGSAHQHQFVTLAGDEVDREFDFLLLGPFLAQFLKHIIGAGHPMVPYRDAQLARRVSTSRKRCSGQSCGGRRAPQNGPPCQPRRSHPILRFESRLRL